MAHSLTLLLLDTQRWLESGNVLLSVHLLRSSVSLESPTLLFFPFEDVRRNELDELIVEDIQDAARDQLKLVLFARQVAAHNLNQRRAQRAVILNRHVSNPGFRALRNPREHVCPVVGRLSDRCPLLAEERGLKSETIHDAELLENGYSSSGLLALLNSEATVFQRKEVVPLATEKRDDPELGVSNPTLLFVVLESAAVEEGIVLSRVAVQVGEQSHLPLTVHMPDDVLSVENRRMKESVGLLPLAVEVTAQQRAAIVTEDYAVWVEHGHDSNDKVLPQLLCLLADQIV